MHTEDLSIYGDFNTASAQQLKVQLKKCTGRPDCKTDEEIIQFMKGKFIMIMLNQVRFDDEKFGSQAIIKESRLLWLTINTQVKQSNQFTLTRT